MVRIKSKPEDWVGGRAVPALPYYENGVVKYHPPYMITMGVVKDGIMELDVELNDDQIYYLEQQGMTVEVLDAD